jgi:phenazine biosynthesis protein phzE
MTADLSARDAIAALQEHEAWAIIRRSTRAGDRETVGLVGGRRREVESLLDIPLEHGVPESGLIADRLVAVPFRQVRERGFEAHDDGTPLVVVDVESEREFSVEEIVDAIDDTGVELADRGGFDIDDPAYADLVATIIRDEIGQGEGANLVIGQPRAARLGARRGRPDEPDQRHLPPRRRRRTPRPPGLPGGREGDLRALHGRGRRAEDDVRHL